MLICIYIAMHIETLQTLADPTRLTIVNFLRGGEHTVNDITDNVEIHQSGVSRHLRILHENGFVQARADGQKRYYSLRPEPFRELNTWLAGYRSFWEARLDKFGEALHQRQKAHHSKHHKESKK